VSAGSGALDGSPATPSSAQASETCLDAAAARGDLVEVVLVLRGRLRRRRGCAKGFWSLRLEDGHCRVFSPETVIAVTPLAPRNGSAALRTQSPAATRSTPRLAVGTTSNG
jgi:hypothetical protein